MKEVCLKELRNDPNYIKLIDLAIEEDLGAQGDITSEAVISSSSTCNAKINSKSEGIIAGLEVARTVFHRIDSEIEFNAHLLDGDQVAVDEILADVAGSTISVLKAERISLNFLSLLSGVATTTKKFVDETKGTKAEIFDTRKTHPGLRSFEKYAVRTGGGSNHRFGLFDQVLIKDNHLSASNSLKAAIGSGKKLGVTEIEVEDLSQLKEAIEAGPDIIMLDNMDIDMIKEAVSIVGGRIPLEVSGGVTLDNVKEFAFSGVERISVGAITMSATPLDISMDIFEARRI